MEAAVRTWQIGSFGIDNLEQVERPMPPPGPEQVRICVHAVSLNYRDLMMVKGFYNPKLELPRVPCSDGAGEIVAVGADVHDWKPGDRVAGIFMQRWLEGRATAARQREALGGDVDGMLSEYVVLNASGIVRVPEHLSYEEAATLPCAGVTAWNAVVNAGDIRAGDTVVIQGTGGVSVFALQFAKLLGARVLGTSSSDEKLERARKLGLDAGLNYKKDSDWAKWVTEQTISEGADLVVEVGGAGTFSQSLKAVRIGGTIAQIGVLAKSEQPLQIAPILHKQVKIQGIYVGSRADFNAMNRAITQNRMRPVMDRIFNFSDAREAFQAMESGSHFGKIVIRVTP